MVLNGHLKKKIQSNLNGNIKHQYSRVITTLKYTNILGVMKWDQYITPEGKFEIVLYGKSYYDEKEKKSIRQFVTNDDGVYPAKSPIGMFDLYIPNDLGFVVDKIAEYYE